MDHGEIGGEIATEKSLQRRTNPSSVTFISRFGIRGLTKEADSISSISVRDCGCFERWESQESTPVLCHN